MISKKRMVEKIAAQKLQIEPLDKTRISETGIDLTIGGVYEMECASNRTVDTKNPPTFKKKTLSTRGLILKPGEVYLIETAEHIYTQQTCGMVAPVQNIVRTGLNFTTGVVDYGYRGPLLLTVTATKDTKIYAGMEIAKFSMFDSSISPKERYQGHFQNGQINMKGETDGRKD